MYKAEDVSSGLAHQSLVLTHSVSFVPQFSQDADILRSGIALTKQMVLELLFFMPGSSELS